MSWGNTAPTFNAVMLLSALQRGDQQNGVKAARKGSILIGIVVFLGGALILTVYLGVGATRSGRHGRQVTGPAFGRP